MGCMKPINENAIICPFCGYNSQSEQHSPYLPKETVLAGRYLAGKVISVDTDSATYIGYDLQCEKVIQIHEFLPEKIITRNENSAVISAKVGYEKMFYACMQSFTRLWRTLLDIKKPSAIETVTDIFNENSTAYVVCEYIDGITLDEYFQRIDKPLSWEETHKIFSSVLFTLTKLHDAGIVHGSISPLSIILDSDGNLRITGFSIPQTKSFINELRRPMRDGFAPVEIYQKPVTLTPATDIYSVAAVMYTALTGSIPPACSRRTLADPMIFESRIAKTLPENVINAIITAMKIYPRDRFNSIADFQSMLNKKAESKTKAAVPQPTKNEAADADDTEKSETAQSSDQGSTAGLVVKTFLCAVIVCTIVFCTFYATFLYKNVEIPFLDNALGAFSFLPMNMSEAQTSRTTVEITTEPPTTIEETAHVPDFTALTYDEIRLDAVLNRNYNLEYKFEYSDEYPKNAVISQSISKGQTVNKGTTIVLVISSGKEKVLLRDVIGLNYDVAYIMLTNDGFTVRKKVISNDGSQLSNTVNTMSLVAGLEFEKGTEITLTVWD